MFVMYNLKLKNRHVKKDDQSCDFDDLSSDDEWITEDIQSQNGGDSDGAIGDEDDINEVIGEDMECQQGEDAMEFDDSGNEIDQPLETSRDLELNSNNANVEGSTNNALVDNDLEGDCGDEYEDSDDDEIGLGQYRSIDDFY